MGFKGIKGLAGSPTASRPSGPAAGRAAAQRLAPHNPQSAGASPGSFTQLPLPPPHRGGAVAQAAAGDNFSAFVLRDGDVLTCGDNIFGQLGHGDGRERPTPRLVDGSGARAARQNFAAHFYGSNPCVP